MIFIPKINSDFTIFLMRYQKNRASESPALSAREAGSNFELKFEIHISIESYVYDNS